MLLNSNLAMIFQSVHSFLISWKQKYSLNLNLSSWFSAVCLKLYFQLIQKFVENIIIIQQKQKKSINFMIGSNKYNHLMNLIFPSQNYQQHQLNSIIAQ